MRAGRHARHLAGPLLAGGASGCSGQGRYRLEVGRYSRSYDLVYVIEETTSRLIVVAYNTQTKAIMRMDDVDLAKAMK